MGHHQSLIEIVSDEILHPAEEVTCLLDSISSNIPDIKVVNIYLSNYEAGMDLDFEAAFKYLGKCLPTKTTSISQLETIETVKSFDTEVKFKYSGIDSLRGI